MLHNDTLLAREYLNKTDNFKEGSNYDNSLEYLIKAGNIYSKHELNEAFYKDFLNKFDETDEFKHSLRSAKLKLIEDGKYGHPFFWSPFVLIGK